jgi:hypothetical protein
VATFEEVQPPDTTAPNTEITSPSEAAGLMARPVFISGTATDDRGVESVGVTVRDASTGLWLQADGATFGPSEVTLPTTLGQPGGTSTTWSMSVDPPNADYVVTATALDASANPDPTAAARSFRLDTTPPDGLAGSPARNEIVTTATPVFTGTANDDRGVSRVTVSIRNLQTMQYLLADGTWQNAFAQINTVLGTPGGIDTTWTLTAPTNLSNGTYRYEVRAYDAVGNLDPTRPTIPFTVST